MASRKVTTFEDAERLIKLWANMERQNHIPIAPDEITQKQYAAMIGASHDKAAKILDIYVQAKTWTVREAMVNGKRGLAYKPKVKPKVKPKNGK